MTQVGIDLSITCKNCQTTFEGKFCSNCSQRADTHRFTLKHFGHEVFHALTHTDKGIFFLIKELFISPGKVAQEFNSGFRKKYFNPFTFLLIITAVQVFITKKTSFSLELANSAKAFTEQFVPQNKTVNDQKKYEEINQKTDKQVSTATENTKLLMILFIPLLSFLTWVFFKKSGYNYSENLVFNVLVNGELSLFFLLFTVVPFLILPSFVLLWLMIGFVITIIYSLCAYKQFYKQHWATTILKGLMIQILYMVGSQVLTMQIIRFI
jgi:hypothetical protein